MIQAILNGSVPTPVEQFRAAERVRLHWAEKKNAVAAQ